MDVETHRSNFLTSSVQEQMTDNNEENIINIPLSHVDYEFDASQCLFCNQISSELDQNILHMSKTHGLYLDLENLLVDVGTLLAYCHLIISGRYECLYCGTQRNTRQAVQQHMIAKGHCKYDISDQDAELRDFYEFSSNNANEKQYHHLSTRRLSNSHSLPSPAGVRKSRPPKRSDRQDPSISSSPLDSVAPAPHPQPHTEPSPNAAETPLNSRSELSTRALKQESTLNNQLSQLRADDRRSLLHLPASQQRAILATHHKQMEKARRTEQTNRSNLESAGNKFNCLDKIRLIRKPPHTGNVFSLNR